MVECLPCTFLRELIVMFSYRWCIVNKQEQQYKELRRLFSATKAGSAQWLKLRSQIKEIERSMVLKK